MTQNEDIREFLTYYCSLPKEPQYAVLLSGLWGSGKTWFIKDFVARHLLKPERVLYLSLYGVQSFDDIESEFFRQRHPLLGSQPVRVLGRLARGVLKTSINFDWDEDGSSDGSLSAGVPADKLLERISLDPNQILILDDLERCPIPISNLLGYVNQFVEHGGIKTILIANEAELLSQSRNNNSDYERIKEKLIGRTFEVYPEVRAALEHFASELPTIRAKEVVQANLATITQIYECSSYRNLRLVRHALWDFDRLLQAVDPSVYKYPDLLSDVLKLFLSYSLEIRSGSIRPNQIKELQDSLSYYLRKSDGKQDPDQFFHDIRKKYSTLNLDESLIPAGTWEALFATGSVPQIQINEALLQSKYFQDENQPNWVRLWYGVNLSDADFAKVLSEVEADWCARKYRNVGEVIHIVGQFVRFAKIGIVKHSVEQVLESARTYIDNMLATGDLPIPKPNDRRSPFDRDAYYGLGYTSLDEEKFQEFLRYIGKRSHDAMIARLPSEASALLDLMEVDSNLFLRRITLSNDPENIYYKTPILHLIPPVEFVKRLLSISPESRREVAHSFEGRYRIESFNLELVPELPWLRNIEELLRTEIRLRNGKISSLSLSWIVDPYVTDAIKALEAAAPE